MPYTLSLAVFEKATKKAPEVWRYAGNASGNCPKGLRYSCQASQLLYT